VGVTIGSPDVLDPALVTLSTPGADRDGYDEQCLRGR
jgi:hypothetical protein